MSFGSENDHTRHACTFCYAPVWSRETTLASVPCFWYGKTHGEMSEWFNVLVLKTNVARVTVGSNPTLSENYHR